MPTRLLHKARALCVYALQAVSAGAVHRVGAGHPRPSIPHDSLFGVPCAWETQRPNPFFLVVVVYGEWCGGVRGQGQCEITAVLCHRLCVTCGQSRICSPSACIRLLHLAAACFAHGAFSITAGGPPFQEQKKVMRCHAICAQHGKYFSRWR